MNEHMVVVLHSNNYIRAMFTRLYYTLITITIAMNKAWELLFKNGVKKQTTRLI